MLHLLSELRRNLRAGARLAFGLPVDLLSFRINLGALLILIALSLLIDVAAGWVVAAPGARFSIFALPNFTFAAAVFVVTAALLGVALGAPNFALACAVLVYAASPWVQLAQTAYRLVAAQPARGAAIVWVAWTIITLWLVLVIMRAIALALPRHGFAHWPRVTIAALAIFGATFAAESYFGPAQWWYAARQGRGEDYSRILSEEALSRQPQILRDALDALAPQRPGVVDLYFVGFAPYADQDVFRKDVEMASAVVDERFDGKGRSVLLVNNPRTVLSAPLATATNLRATLQAVGRKIDPEEDVVLLFLSSHGTHDHRLAVHFPPLRLNDVTPAALKSMLDDAGIRWRIVVISACYSGGFIPALADDRTLVLTAAATDRTSFGCADDSDLTYFADALFNHALRHQLSLPDAFRQARELVKQRENDEHLSPPSEPQMSIGPAIERKLPVLETRLRQRLAGSATCDSKPC